jgi:hypothetical protein
MIERPIYSRVCKDAKDFKSTITRIEFLPGVSDLDVFPCEVVVSKWKPKRSDQANRYLWGVVYAIISQETGNEVNDLHEFYLGSFFGWEEYKVFDKTKLRPRERSSKQIKARFSEFIEYIIAHAAGLGIIVPPPETDKTW